MSGSNGLKGPACPRAVMELIKRFALHRDTYRQPTYNETQVRREFIDPLFKALAWDVDNEQGHAEAYKDVIHEDAIKVGAFTKAPDYCFRIGGVRKFFVEAKKPAEDLKQRPEHAYQLRRYAWTAKLPISILTDFEEFAVFDCTKRPKPTDKASAGRILYFTYDQYPEKWGEIWSRFSKEAILKGEFDRFAASAKRKRGTAEVDDEFLKEIEQWREWLARNIALRNAKLTIRDLNYAVTKTIDRIIFLRMCEDRGIETAQQLSTLRNGPNIYRRMVEIFRRADERYNSGLFHFEPERGRAEAPDTLTPELEIDDKVLKDIITRLYYPECPYEFSVMPPEILGQVYEQFLGKVITLTPAHRARVEDKPEVKKAGGVYYTPKYIVDYIVEHTVGKLLQGKRPRDVGVMLEQRKPIRAQPSRARKEADHTSPLTKGGSKGGRNAALRILDPACGSGSFLIGAYQYLLDWHLRWYSEHDPQGWARKRNPPIYQSPKADPTARGPTWRLTVAEKKRILLNNIYGVDIDAQAVEVTKLSLLLKVLEGESQETLDNQLRFFHERALPDLGHNIKCGNSLIGPDFYEGKQFELFDEEERYRINAFDWEAEFPGVFQSRDREGAGGGFDAVIGNPPWGQKDIEKDSTITIYLRDAYPSIGGIFDLFRPFVEKGIDLTRPDGLFGMVLPDIVLLKNYEATRRFILENTSVEHIDWWGMAFQEVVIDAATIIGWKRPAPSGHTVVAAIHQQNGVSIIHIPQHDFWRNERLTFNLFLTPEKRALLDAFCRFPKLGDYFEIHEGVHSGNIRKELFVDRKTDTSCHALYFGRDEIAPYVLKWNGRYIRLDALPKRRSTTRYANAGQPHWHEREKVLVRRTGDYLLAAVDTERMYASNNFFLVFPLTPGSLDLFGLCALVNSRLMTWYFRAIEPRVGRVFAELKIKHLRTVPLPDSVDICTSLNELGRERWNAARAVLGAKSPQSIDLARRTCRMLTTRIDDLVCDGFGLNGKQRDYIIKETLNAKDEDPER